MVEKKECVLCSKSITTSRWSQHINSKSHQDQEKKEQRSLTPIIPEEDQSEEGVLDDDCSTETGSSCYTSGTDLSD
ncbi:MAG TPA: hypothetical protein V6C58_01180 [Allocoleopsis sp.]